MHTSRLQGTLKEDQLLCYPQAALVIRVLDLVFASRAMELTEDPLLELLSLYKTKNNPSAATEGNLSPVPILKKINY